MSAKLKVKSGVQLFMGNHSQRLGSATCHVGSHIYLPTDTGVRAAP